MRTDITLPFETAAHLLRVCELTEDLEPEEAKAIVDLRIRVTKIAGKIIQKLRDTEGDFYKADENKVARKMLEAYAGL